MQKIKKVTRRLETYDPLLRNYERFNQTAFLLAPEKVGTKGRAQAAIMGYLLNWYPYRQQCGKIGEWIFASHEKLARKNGITVRQSQEAVAVLKRYDRIQTAYRKVGGLKTLHMRPTGATLKLVNKLGHKWASSNDDFQPVWDEALNVDLMASNAPKDLTLFHLMKEWDRGEHGIPLLLTKLDEIWFAAKARIEGQPPANGDTQADKTPHTGAAESPSTGSPYTDTDIDTDSIDTDIVDPAFSSLEKGGGSVLGNKKKLPHSVPADVLPPQFDYWQDYYEHTYPDMSPKEHVDLFYSEHPDKLLSAFSDFFA